MPTLRARTSNDAPLSPLRKNMVPTGSARSLIPKAPSTKNIPSGRPGGNVPEQSAAYECVMCSKLLSFEHTEYSANSKRKAS